MKNIGVLAMQGAVEEHLAKLSCLPDVHGYAIKSKEQLDGLDGLIIPGGESTAIGKLMSEFDIMMPLRNKIEHGFPVWGTCAGMILLAKKIVEEDIEPTPKS